MPIFYNKKRIRHLTAGGKDIVQVNYGTKPVWTNKVNFATTTWDEVAELLGADDWQEQGWQEGITHLLVTKSGKKLTARVVAVYDGREDEVDENGDSTYPYQIDHDENGNKPHLVMEITQSVESGQALNSTSLSTSNSFNQLEIFSRLCPGGDLYDDLPDNVQSLIIPVMKKYAATGQAKTSTPVEVKSYLFFPALCELVGEINDSVNTSEGGQYYYYYQNPNAIQRAVYGDSSGTPTYYWTRSASQYEDSSYNYYWAAGSATGYAMYSSQSELPITYLFCI